MKLEKTVLAKIASKGAFALSLVGLLKVCDSGCSTPGSEKSYIDRNTQVNPSYIACQYENPTVETNSVYRK